MARQSGQVDREWQTPLTEFTWQHVEIEVLMDIRDQLKKLNRVLECPRFLRIPTSLDSIDRKLTKKKPRRKKAAARA
jgi:hypothetical protein